jgi:hypothetical protein
MSDVARLIVAVSHRTYRSLVVIAPALAVVIGLASVSLVSAQAAEVRITEVQCNRDPEVVTITNQGSVAQDLAGWTLRSDPIASERFDLSAIGTLAPGVSVFVQSGPAASGAFVWSTSLVLRDSDATDFVRIVDANENVVHEVKCQGTGATAAPTAAPTPAPTPAPFDVVPVGGGPPGTGSWQSAGLMAIAGAWLLAAVLGSLVLMRLRQSDSQPVFLPATSAVAYRARTDDPTAAWGRWMYLLLLLVLALTGLAAARNARGSRDS